MVELKIVRDGDKAVIVLSDGDLAALQAQVGDAVVVSRQAEIPSEEARLERGRRFLKRYRSTFDDLAK